MGTLAKRIESTSGRRDGRIDDYIDRRASFAQPILIHLRALVHQACPDVEESIKWGVPSFSYGGAILCGMAAFKQHMSFGFWKHALVVGDSRERDGMGSYGRITALADLPPRRTILAHIRKAMVLNTQPAASSNARKRKAPRPAPRAPADLLDALKRNKAARTVFAAFPPSSQRDYIEWITGAKREQTRRLRLEQAVKWMAEGKRRNWKYES